MSYEIIQYVLYGIAAGVLLCIALTYDKLERIILNSCSFALFITACLLLAVKVLRTGEITGPLIDYGLGMIVLFVILYVIGLTTKFRLVGFGSVKLGASVGLLLGIGAGLLALGLWWMMVLIYLTTTHWPKDDETIKKYRGAFWLLAVVAAFIISIV